MRTPRVASAPLGAQPSTPVAEPRICEKCGSTYTKPPKQTHSAWEKRRFCCLSCSSQASLAARLAARGRRPPADLPAPGAAPTDHTWREHAACRGENPDLFVPSTPSRRRPAAMALCARCPVRQPCLAYGIATQSDGVWGGQYLRAGKRGAQ